MDANTVKNVINDLIKINNDRIDGYQKAIEQLEDNNNDADLVQVFNDCISGSEKYKTELIKVSGQYATEAIDETTVPGEIYRFWMDMKVTFTGNTRLTVLESCEFGEDAAQKAYNEALENYKDLPLHIIQLITTQKTNLRESHDKVKRLRDLEKIAD